VNSKKLYSYEAICIRVTIAWQASANRIWLVCKIMLHVFLPQADFVCVFSRYRLELRAFTPVRASLPYRNIAEGC